MPKDASAITIYREVCADALASKQLTPGGAKTFIRTIKYVATMGLSGSQTQKAQIVIEKDEAGENLITVDMLCLRADQQDTNEKKMDVAYSFCCAEITNPLPQNLDKINQMIEKLIDAGTRSLPWGDQEEKTLMIASLKEVAFAQLACQLPEE